MIIKTYFALNLMNILKRKRDMNTIFVVEHCRTVERRHVSSETYDMKYGVQLKLHGCLQIF